MQQVKSQQKVSRLDNRRFSFSHTGYEHKHSARILLTDTLAARLRRRLVSEMQVHEVLRSELPIPKVGSGP
jgi:hypothetical protein